MAFELLKTSYQDDILDESVNQIRRYAIVNNADGSISLVDTTAYRQTGTFIGAKDINSMCANMNTIMGYLDTTDGNIVEEFNTYFAKQKQLFEERAENENTAFITQFNTLLRDFKTQSEAEFNTWFDSVKGQLSGDVAGNLLLQIQEQQEQIAALANRITTITDVTGLEILQGQRVENDHGAPYRFNVSVGGILVLNSYKVKERTGNFRIILQVFEEDNNEWKPEYETIRYNGYMNEEAGDWNYKLTLKPNHTYMLFPYGDDYNEGDVFDFEINGYLIKR